MKCYPNVAVPRERSRVVMQKYSSGRQGNGFIHFIDVKEKLILGLLCDRSLNRFTSSFSTSRILQRGPCLAGDASADTDWFDLCLEVCSEIVSVGRHVAE
ncbi:hypothetical protein E2C01_071446 [Portunus trituberculatus]|uniref:Uncharacterized protein n=1 Tax=Portunus trituberculatus TaxID=210409 RepID=A0A5B7I803_PORTR|nr:hypothetical protein [Portunus trituberculatus]